MKTLLIGIGAMKCGTTWLHDYLESHPEFFASPIKEMSFFSSKYGGEQFAHILPGFINRYKTVSGNYQLNEQYFKKVRNLSDRIIMEADPSLYIEYFERRMGDETSFGEISPSYSELSAEVFAKMEEVHENTKFIFLMRDPVDRVLSHIRYHAKLSPNLSLAQATAAAKVHNSIHQRNSDYAATIINLESGIKDQSRIKYIFYENLFTDKTIQEICDFIGISFHPAQFSKHSNQNTAITLVDEEQELRAFFRQQLDPVYRFCSERFGDDVPDEWMVEPSTSPSQLLQ